MLTRVSGNKVEYDISTYKINTYRNHRKEKTDNNIKFMVATGSSVSTLLPLVLIAKKQNVKIYNIKYGIKELLSTSTCGIAGGTLTGLALDKKEYRKQKLNEGVFQFMNSTVPTLICAGLLALSDKFSSLNNTAFKISGTLFGLFAGMHLAATLSNKINDPYDKVPDRKLTIKDSIANIDDAFGALVLAKVPIAEKLHADKILPVIFSWCGYRAGVSN